MKTNDHILETIKDKVNDEVFDQLINYINDLKQEIHWLSVEIETYSGKRAFRRRKNDWDEGFYQ